LEKKIILRELYEDKRKENVTDEDKKKEAFENQEEKKKGVD